MKNYKEFKCQDWTVSFNHKIKKISDPYTSLELSLPLRKAIEDLTWILNLFKDLQRTGCCLN